MNEQTKQHANKQADIVTRELDVDAALAAVSDLVALTEPEDAAGPTTAKAPESSAALIPMPQPPWMDAGRSRIVTRLPALILIGLGAWLGLGPDTLPAAPTLALMLTAAAGLSLLAWWVASGRWSRGACFMGSTLLIMSTALLYLTRADNLSAAASWPPLLVLMALPFVLTGLLCRPTDKRLILLGLVLITAGAAGLLVMAGPLETDRLTELARLWPLSLVLMAILLILPLLNRKHRT